ncbi:pterin 4 alpha carbinolamine dehydratase [Trypanosoma brucei equiperdum]|uniref:4a-hydroxytetrahydrobiopterin dehydratase n=1 Tax=Trypanosoma brucei equiperdum TaxID=630700 RepID=A0A3L6L381_9TRYP|nr:pterin 4 alpha carbinolamine dehydratase [Trypanosoma brucei equiperdum]
MNVLTSHTHLHMRRSCCMATARGCLGNIRTSDVSTRRCKGDYGFNIFHNSNPQHGASYARHERRMREDEVEDFLKSVKGWVPVDECFPCVDADADAEGADVRKEEKEEMGPAPLTIFTGEGALKRDFDFANFRDAYLFMGRLWAFCYGSDKYPNVTWEGTRITVYIYSPSFRGLSKREARLAAFLNDQYNMFKKSKRQQKVIIDGVVKRSVIEDMMGECVAEALKRREEERRKPLAETVEGIATSWEAVLSKDGNNNNNGGTPSSCTSP